jgi:hypothetical protein
MKITLKILSIPPYLSTTWDNISSISMSDTTLCIILLDGTEVQIPDLPSSTIDDIFETHVNYTEATPSIDSKNPQLPADAAFSQFAEMMGDGNLIGLPLQFGPGGFEGMGNMQHNPLQANMPDLPSEVLEKISGIAKILAADETANLPNPVPNCNCFYCQIAASLNPQEEEELINLNEEVSDADLTFREWDIEKSNDKLYTVSNPTDEEESFSVYLGETVGCTCGEKNCAHIKAVLMT